MSGDTTSVEGMRKDLEWRAQDEKNQIANLNTRLLKGDGGNIEDLAQIATQNDITECLIRFHEGRLDEIYRQLGVLGV